MKKSRKPGDGKKKSEPQNEAQCAALKMAKTLVLDKTVKSAINCILATTCNQNSRRSTLSQFWHNVKKIDNFSELKPKHKIWCNVIATSDYAKDIHNAFLKKSKS